MSKAYRIAADGTTTPMDRIHVRNEEQDLQLLLERNPELLCGEQIRPRDPCRWLLVDREIAVPDPESGADRWSLDLFFVDQHATPTLVECKRFVDTRSRREVVAQMLDYAANANEYWQKDDLRSAAEAMAEKYGSDLDSELARLGSEWIDGADAFFQRVEDNLREGQVRMVFFLEESPWQLRSIVDFLNRQMERSEMLLIEARHYQDGESCVVVPHLFGYTEEARRVKRTVTVNKSERQQWDREKFLNEMDDKFGADARVQYEHMVDELKALGAELHWGKGIKTGSLSPKWPAVASLALISFATDGKLTLNLPYLTQSEQNWPARDRLLESIKKHTDLPVADNCYEKYPIYTWSEWQPSIDGVLAAIRETVTDSKL
jgi:hypothetical protein